MSLTGTDNVIEAVRGIDEGWIEPPCRRSLTPPALHDAAEPTALVLREDRGD